ncbi:MAG TPA: hypothetical protein VGE54_04885 [Brevundimonas sp.]
MSDEPEQPLDPFPTAIPTVSPFPPLENEPVTDWVEQADAHDLPTRENKLVALGRFAFPPAPPLDDEGVAARDRRWTSRTIVFLAVFMLIFNAASIQNWSRQQAPGWVTSTVQQLSDVWSAQLSQLGADQPRHAIRTAYDNARAARFPGQEPAQP